MNSIGAVSPALLASGAAKAQAAGPEQLPTQHGLSYLSAFGIKNYPVVNLLYGMIAVSLFIITVVGALVLIGSLRSRARAVDGHLETVHLERSGRGLGFIYVGTGLSLLGLLGILIWGLSVMAAIADPPGSGHLTIRVTGHQWWWEVEYVGEAPYRTFKTANEIHIPVGRPVRIELQSEDVIHSFWVPALTGKTDLIPTMNNQTWLEADRAGIYRGQCTEYCGQQHAHMAFLVVAEAPDAFEAWWSRQLEGPSVPTDPVASERSRQGLAAFMQHCAVCHAVRGTPASGRVGPDLSHLMLRKSLAAGTVPNSVGHLAGWISNPQQIKPGNEMPTLTLSNAELAGVVDFLKTLN